MARVIEITTPLGADVLLFHRMRAREETSRLFEYEIDLLSRKADVDLTRSWPPNVTVKLELPEGKTRHFNGYVTRFAQVGRSVATTCTGRWSGPGCGSSPAAPTAASSRT